MTTKQALGELKKLAKTAADNLYRRIELAGTVLQDLDWIAKVHDGSDLKAQDALQSEFFADLGGYVTLGKLIAMWRGVPQKEWAECRYDVAAVEAVYDGLADPQKQETGQRTAWKALAEQRGDELEVAQRQLGTLRVKVEALTSENDRLRGRIEQLESMIPQAAAA